MTKYELALLIGAVALENAQTDNDGSVIDLCERCMAILSVDTDINECVKYCYENGLDELIDGYADGGAKEFGIVGVTAIKFFDYI